MSYIRRKRVPYKTKAGKRDAIYYYRVEGIRTDGKVKQVVRDYLGTATEAMSRLDQVNVDEQEMDKLKSKLNDLIQQEQRQAKSAA